MKKHIQDNAESHTNNQL